MYKRDLSDGQLAGVSGGAAESGFSPVAEEFARRNGCAGCPHASTYRPHAMCLEVYNELLRDFIDNRPIAARCTRRG